MGGRPSCRTPYAALAARRSGPGRAAGSSCRQGRRCPPRARRPALEVPERLTAPPSLVGLGRPTERGVVVRQQEVGAHQAPAGREDVQPVGAEPPRQLGVRRRPVEPAGREQFRCGPARRAVRLGHEVAPGRAVRVGGLGAVIRVGVQHAASEWGPRPGRPRRPRGGRRACGRRRRRAASSRRTGSRTARSASLRDEEGQPVEEAGVQGVADVPDVPEA